MQVSRKQLQAMIEEEAERTQRLQESPNVRNVKEPLNAEELDMLDLLLTRADLYGEAPAGFDPDVFGNAIDAVAELYKAAKAGELHPSYAGGQGGDDGQGVSPWTQGEPKQ